MTNLPKRTLTPSDIVHIAELWRQIRALQTLRENALPPTAQGAWIREAVDVQLQTLYEDLDKMFRTIEDPELDEGR